MHRRIILLASPGNTVPKASLREADSLPYRRKDNPCAVGADIICPPGEPMYHPGCPFRQYCAKGNVFRTPREGRPYGHKDNPCAVIRYRAKGRLRALSAPAGHLPREGEVYKASPCRGSWIGQRPRLMRWSLPMCRCSTLCQRQPPPHPPLRGTSPERGRFLARAGKDGMVLIIKERNPRLPLRGSWIGQRPRLRE